jgi:hypothetical protein
VKVEGGFQPRSKRTWRGHLGHPIQKYSGSVSFTRNIPALTHVLHRANSSFGSLFQWFGKYSSCGSVYLHARQILVVGTGGAGAGGTATGGGGWSCVGGAGPTGGTNVFCFLRL